MNDRASAEDVIERLAGHKALHGVPRNELEWLAAHGDFVVYPKGSVVAHRTQPIDIMVIMLVGQIAVHFGHGTGRIHKMEAFAGELTGLLPFSRMNLPAGDAVATSDAEVVSIHRDHFPELIRECPVTTARMVHSMIDRARVAAATNWQDEKMMSLGRLAAGFAHQLNNPSSAAVRSAKQVSGAVRSVGEAAHALGRCNLDDAQRGCVDRLLQRCLKPASRGQLTAIERADREELIADWLALRNIDTSPAVSLADCNVRVDELEALQDALPVHAMEPSLRWVAAAHTADLLASDVEQTSGRIHDLIAGLQRFTSMDRAAVAQPLDVSQGIADTVAVLAGRAASRSISVRLAIAPGLPMLTAYSADLNQVWANLIENAIDAAPTGGDVMVCADAADESQAVVVRVIDNGSGIAPDVEARMFDPFFTTKGVGEGMGFGLDIVRRIVHMHDGGIEVDTRPGRTEFRVHIPVVGARKR